MSGELLILSRMYSLSARGREIGGEAKGREGEGKWEEFARNLLAVYNRTFFSFGISHVTRIALVPTRAVYTR